MKHLSKQRRMAVHWRALAALALLCASLAALPRITTTPVVWAQDAIVALPAAPGLAAPVDGAMLDDPWGSIELQWLAVHGAVDYQVILNGGERTGPWVTETSWSPGSLPQGSYQWAVQARNAAGISALGPEFAFTVTPAGGYEASEAIAPETLEPLPFQLQQQAQQGKDGVAVESDGAAGTAPAPAPAPASNTTTDTAAAAPAPAGTPVPTPVAEAPPPIVEEPPADGAIVTDGANVVDNSGAASEDGGKNKDKDKQDKKSDDAAEDEKPEREKREREPREERPNHRSNGNGGVAEIIAVPPTWAPPSYAMPEAFRRMPLELHQQDATDATAGSVGESGTINGQPRETTDNAPAEIVGPGAPGEVILPPSVPGVPATGNLDPGVVAGIGGTTELTFDAISDTTVFTSSPGSPQSPESINSLAIGGPQGAVTLMSFHVEGVGDGTVLGARLTFYGAGAAGAPGGSVGVIYDYVVPDGLTANGVPDGGSALNVHGAPSWFERVEPDGLTAVDVTGTVSGDGKITFVLPGQAEAAGAVYSLESGAPPQLILTVALPA